MGKTNVAMIALLLVHGVQSGRKMHAPGTVMEFEADEAERLIAKGAAMVPPAPPAGAPTAVVEKVSALSDAGGKFLKAKTEEKAAAFVLEQTDVATVAELQALEYRREGGPRATVMEAIALAMHAATGAQN
jgi:hypothetical protein